ncbi:MAG: hypothetical protein QOD47_2080 [Gemmatimonadaceae bacterium]|nr:hypothetical protein [Gemmatimonadaceae bacterium]
MTAFEANYLVGNPELFQSRLLRGDQIGFGKFVLSPKYHSDRRTS